ncbi:MAG: response regulator [Patescibacteria group bacterium]
MKKILFIEDESALQKAVTAVLAEEGFEVRSAVTGEDGLALAKRDVPDIILLDLVLPQKDGFAVLEELKKDPATSRVPVIIMSNLESSADVQKALDRGAMTYLVKMNYKLEDVVEKIRQTLKE